MFEVEKHIKNILWDFDGVLMDSMEIRDQGFEVVLSSHPKEDVDSLMKFHRANGGLSRYVKFRYFFEKIKKQEISDEQVQQYADSFSQVMLERMMDERLLIADALDFVKSNHQKYRMHVVSGSDQSELRQICENLGIKRYFKSIHGSPTPKTQLVQQVLQANSYKADETILIGDSINDYDAAVDNGIAFYGYNNIDLEGKGNNYIQKFGSI